MVQFNVVFLFLRFAMKKILLFSFALVLLLSVVGFAQTPSPANLTATVVTTGHHPAVKLAWEYDSMNVPVRFGIYKKFGLLEDTSSRFYRIWTTHNKQYIDYYVRPGMTYSYYVTAIVQHTESEPSNSVEAEVVQPVVPHGVISGVLFEDSTNAVLVRGVVHFVPASNIVTMPKVIETDSNGFFKARLNAGTYYMFTAARGYVPEYYDNAATLRDATVITVQNNDSLVFLVGLAKIVPPTFYTLSGSVKDSAGSPQRAEVRAFLVNRPNGIMPHAHKLRTFTDSLGNFTLTLKENDTVVIYVFPHNRTLLPEYWDNKRTFAEADRIAITGNIAGINVTLDSKPVFANGISGTVTDSEGTTPLGAFIYAYRKANTHPMMTKYFAVTDTLTGSYSFTNMEPGNYILLCWSPGYKSTYFRYDGMPTLDWRFADSIVVPENAVIENIDFRLWALPHRNGKTSVQGNVLASTGSGLDAVLVYALDGNNAVAGSAVTDLDGSYEIEGLTTGSYSLVSSAMNYQDGKIGDVEVTDEYEILQFDAELSPDQVLSVRDEVAAPSEYRLNQNYPNPFNPGTVLSFVMGNSSFITLKVYNILGNEVATLVNGEMSAGEHTLYFDGSNLNSGVYYLKLEADNALVAVRKMLLVK
ncbi:MAG: T9SS type A sorting domain-containing protein [Bacteroidetes bacterium]|nr:MAG: T9SS type A sorting domain-containing protein [Bacteroidota bacterium]